MSSPAQAATNSLVPRLYLGTHLSAAVLPMSVPAATRPQRRTTSQTSAFPSVTRERGTGTVCLLSPPFPPYASRFPSRRHSRRACTFFVDHPERTMDVSHYFRQIAISQRRQVPWINRSWARNQRFRAAPAAAVEKLTLTIASRSTRKALCARAIRSAVVSGDRHGFARRSRPATCSLRCAAKSSTATISSRKPRRGAPPERSSTGTIMRRSCRRILR